VGRHERCSRLTSTADAPTRTYDPAWLWHSLPPLRTSGSARVCRPRLDVGRDLGPRAGSHRAPLGAQHPPGFSFAVARRSRVSAGPNSGGDRWRSPLRKIRNETETATPPRERSRDPIRNAAGPGLRPALTAAIPTVTPQNVLTARSGPQERNGSSSTSRARATERA
jgi:hypothetical protein